MTIGGFLGGVFTFAVGGVDEAMIWLISLVIIDYITGSAASLKTGEWCSNKGFHGLFKKLFIFLVVAICNGIDKTTGQEILRNMAIFAYAVNEAGSILENFSRLGFDHLIPSFLKAGLKNLKEKEKSLLEEKNKKD